MAQYARRLTALAVLALLLPAPCLGDESTDNSQREFKAVLSFLRIPDRSLPNGVRLVDKIVTAPIVGVEENPGAMIEREKFVFLGELMGLPKAKVIANVEAGFAALYCDGDPRNEIGVYALQFKSDADSLRTLDQLVEKADSGYLFRKGRLLIRVWKDPGASESALKVVKEYFESADFPSK
jgi:hypothetical protein